MEIGVCRLCVSPRRVVARGVHDGDIARVRFTVSSRWAAKRGARSIGGPLTRRARFVECRVVLEADTFEATVRGGRLVLDVASGLPEGASVPLTRIPPPDASPSPRCDVLLFVTTRTEREMLRVVAGEMGIEPQLIDGRLSRYLDLGRVHPDYRVFAVETEMGALQTGGSATKALLCPIETGARYIIAVGMAFGIDRERQNFGDVLVASHVLSYDAVIVDTESDGRLRRIRYDRVKPVSTNAPMRDLLRRHQERREMDGHVGYKVHFGAMLSGSAQIRCRAYRDHLAEKLNKKLADLDKERRKLKEVLSERIVGGEMEGVGLLATPEGDDGPSWLVVKGISDFADEGHGGDTEEHRHTACANSIRLVLEALAHSSTEDAAK